MPQHQACLAVIETAIVHGGYNGCLKETKMFIDLQASICYHPILCGALADKCYLADVTPNTQSSSIKLVVKLIRKKAANTSSGKKSVQNYVFVDERGSRKRAVTFGATADFLDKHFVLDRTYEVHNVLVKKVDAQYSLYDGELQLILTRLTKIRALESVQDITFTPLYVPLSEFPNMFGKAPFDIVVAVLKIDPPRQVIIPATNLPADIADVYVTDDSLQSVLQLSAWRASCDKCQEISALADPVKIISFSFMKTQRFDGCPTLTTTYDTKIDIAPSGVKALFLKEWATNNYQVLANRFITFKERLSLKKDIPTLTLLQAVTAQISSVSKDEMIRVMASVKAFDEHNPRSFLSCPRCYHQSNGEGCHSQLCLCLDPPVCIAKLYLDFTVVDGETTYPLQARPKTAEKLLGIKAMEFIGMTKQAKTAFVEDVKKKLSSTRIAFILGPNETSLNFSKVKWELQYVVRD